MSAEIIALTPCGSTGRLARRHEQVQDAARLLQRAAQHLVNAVAADAVMRNDTNLHRIVREAAAVADAAKSYLDEAA